MERGYYLTENWIRRKRIDVRNKVKVVRKKRWYIEWSLSFSSLCPPNILNLMPLKGRVSTRQDQVKAEMIAQLTGMRLIILDLCFFALDCGTWLSTQRNVQHTFQIRGFTCLRLSLKIQGKFMLQIFAYMKHRWNSSPSKCYFEEEAPSYCF